jgi:hypothetical protein
MMAKATYEVKRSTESNEDSRQFAAQVERLAQQQVKRITGTVTPSTGAAANTSTQDKR